MAPALEVTNCCAISAQGAGAKQCADDTGQGPAALTDQRAPCQLAIGTIAREHPLNRARCTDQRQRHCQGQRHAGQAMVTERPGEQVAEGRLQTCSGAANRD